MKTLVLLSALVLPAFLAQADSLPEATEETKNEEQPGVGVQDVSISFGDPEDSALQDGTVVSTAARHMTDKCLWSRMLGHRVFAKEQCSCAVWRFPHGL
ncbi:hypothetical protein U0070_025773 [Myodes glareolus]|uniref:Alpha-defensin N-terminal domain-containing protein n=1 Tax=Myodes glareolus TaxID=447135 RepID=A0AAW0J924_MYOGA